jgi:hypothetical protein
VQGTHQLTVDLQKKNAEAANPALAYEDRKGTCGAKRSKGSPDGAERHPGPSLLSLFPALAPLHAGYYAALAFAVGIFATTFRSARSACQRS